MPNKIGIIQTNRGEDCLLNGYFMLLFKMEEQFIVVCNGDTFFEKSQILTDKVWSASVNCNRLIDETNRFERYDLFPLEKPDNKTMNKRLLHFAMLSLLLYTNVYQQA